MTPAPEIEGRDITTRGGRVRVYESGNRAAGPAGTLVFTHGFLSTRRSWEPVMQRLANDYRVVALDLLGFGESEKPSPDKFRYDYEAFAETILDVTAALDLSRVCLVGHGLGGSASLALAARHPSVVERLILVDPFVYEAARSPWISLALTPVFGRVVFKQFYGRKLFDKLTGHYAPGAVLPADSLAAAFEPFNTPQGRESAYATLLGTLDTRGLVAVLPRVIVPTLVIWGQMDPILPSEQGRKLARELSRARLLVLPAGHYPHEETPDLFEQAVRTFLAPKAAKVKRKSRQ